VTSTFEALRQFLYERSGLSLEGDKLYLVESRLLPIAREFARPGFAPDVAAGVQFLDRRQGRVSTAGALIARPESDYADPDHCVTSCSPWSANTHPIFVDGRIFVLLGHELVELRRRDGRISEIRRVSVIPR